MHTRTAVAATTPPLGDATTDTPDETGRLVIAGRAYLTRRGLARLLRISTRTLSRWETARNHPPRAKIGMQVLYPEDRIPQWLDSLAAEAPKRRGRAA